MHNGNIGGWKYVKRNLALGLRAKWFSSVGGTTDSEWAFAVFLDALDRMGYDPDCASLNGTGFGHSVLRKALLATIERINTLIAEIPDTEHRESDEDLECRSLLNFAVTDGHSVVCTRYVSSGKDEAASLYWSSGTSWQEDKSVKGRYRMERRDKGADIVLVASEPLTFERGKCDPKGRKACVFIAFGRYLKRKLSHSPNRRLGHCPNKFDIDDPQASGDDSPNHRQILQPQSIVYPIHWFRCVERAGRDRGEGKKRMKYRSMGILLKISRWFPARLFCYTYSTKEDTFTSASMGTFHRPRGQD